MIEALKFFLKNPVAAIVAAVVIVLSYLGFKLNRAETQRDEARHELLKNTDEQRLREIANDVDAARKASEEKKKKAQDAIKIYVDNKSEIDN